MSKAKYIVLTVILLIFYGAGLPLFIIGITGSDMLLFTVIGLLSCGLPTGVIFWILSRIFDGLGRRDSRLARRLTFFLLGLLLGLAVTPGLIIWCIVKAAKYKPVTDEFVPIQPQPAPQAETPSEPQTDIQNENETK